MNEIKTFEINKIYSMRSVCNYNCVWNAKVLKRTAKFVTLKVDGEKEPVRCKVTVWDNSENCYPLGHYSMAPILRA